MLDSTHYAADALRVGCPPDQIENFIRAGIILQPRQLAASAAARLCDAPGGPTAIGYGGARGGGKSYWLLAQIGADDCQRLPGLKCLLLRKSGKSNLENFDDLRRRLFQGLEHTYSAANGLIFKNGSRILARHYQTEKEIESLLGLEYDVIGIEEATTLTPRKLEDLPTCARTSKPNWRPRIYSTTNPGGIGHEWYYRTFIVPHQRGTESATRFIPARVADNKFINPDYENLLASRTGWQKEAWYHGNWGIAAGQFFNTFRHEIHVLDHFDDNRAVEWFAAMDYGYTHFTVVLLGCLDAQDNLYVVDEHAERLWVPQRHVQAIKTMLQRHKISLQGRLSLAQLAARQHPGRSFGICRLPSGDIVSARDPRARFWFERSDRELARFVAGTDLFGHQSDGSTIASHYAGLGLKLRPANTNRVQGWAEILRRLGDPDAGIAPTLFIHKRCTRLLDTLPYLQHDPDLPADILKTNPNEEGLGGDDAADALRYLVATRPARIYQVKLCGL